MLDLNNLQHMSDQDKARYMMLERLFAQPGWDYVVRLATKDFEDAKHRVLTAHTWDANRVAFGAMTAFYSIMSLRDQIEAEFETIAAKAKAEKTEQDEEENE